MRKVRQSLPTRMLFVSDSPHHPMPAPVMNGMSNKMTAKIFLDLFIKFGGLRPGCLRPSDFSAIFRNKRIQGHIPGL